MDNAEHGQLLTVFYHMKPVKLGSQVTDFLHMFLSVTHIRLAEFTVAYSHR